MRKPQEKFANDTPVQLAKREMQLFFRTRALWAGTICAGLVLAVIGPFGTSEALSLPLRVPYWLTHAVAAFLLGTIGVVWGRDLAQRWSWPLWVGIAMGSVIAATLVWAEVVLVDLAVFGAHRDAGELMVLAANILAICVVISVTYVIVESPEASVQTAPPALLARLAPERRGPLVSLSVSDHYVEVTTTKGSEMILMRLSDAIGETGEDQGLQIHRSHWVSTTFLNQIKRLDGKPHAILRDGRALPVSRTYLPSLKQAGF